MKIKSVFVSSVVQDYADRRSAARQALHDLGFQAVFAEDFAAGPVQPRAQVMRHILDCDALLGIYGSRYGWDKGQRGVSPTEEEYDYAQSLWKPIYAFIDRSETNAMDIKQKQFLDKVQNWDSGVMRNEFYSLAELREKIQDALTTAHQSPRYQQFLLSCSVYGSRAGYREILETRLPDFDLLLHKPASGVHMTFDPDKLLAFIEGDKYTTEQIKHIGDLWEHTLHDFFKPSIWNQTSLEGCMVIAVEINSHQLSPEVLPWKRSARAGGFYGIIVDLKTCRLQHSALKMRDRGVKIWFLDPVVHPALEQVGLTPPALA